jgi:hypothetical protein
MNEIDIYASREAEARANIQRTLSGLKKDVRAAISPRGWVQEKPYASLLVAGSLGLALGFGATRKAKKVAARHPERPVRRFYWTKDRTAAAESKHAEKEKKSSLLARAALFALREAPAVALGLLRGALRPSPSDGTAPSATGGGEEDGARVADLLGSALAPGAGAGKQ